MFSCSFSCAMGITLLFSSLYISLDDENAIYFKRFQESLHPYQLKIYRSIVRERLVIYISGMAIGLVLGLLYYSRYPKDSYRLCKFLCIVYLVKLGIYYVVPKQPLMLYSLKTMAQVEAWADIYTHMKNRWVTSLMVGFVGYILLGCS